MSQIHLKNLEVLRTENAHKKIVFCSGSFDLVHAGHVLFFEDCKKFGDILVVGIGGDAVIKRLKGSQRPIMNEHVRLKTVTSLKPVDYCVLDTHEHPLHPFEFVEAVMRTLRPDVYVVNHDAFDMPSRKKLTQDFGVKLEILKRWCPPEFENISTTRLVEKIKNSS